MLCKGKELPQLYDEIWQQGRPQPLEVATIFYAAVAMLPEAPQLV